MLSTRCWIVMARSTLSIALLRNTSLLQPLQMAPHEIRWDSLSVTIVLVPSCSNVLNVRSVPPWIFLAINFLASLTWTLTIIYTQYQSCYAQRSANAHLVLVLIRCTAVRPSYYCPRSMSIPVSMYSVRTWVSVLCHKINHKRLR